MKKVWNVTWKMCISVIASVMTLVIFITPLVVPIVLVLCGYSGWWFFLLFLYIPIGLFVNDFFDETFFEEIKNPEEVKTENNHDDKINNTFGLD